MAWGITIIYLVLVLALAGAAVLLYLDRRRRSCPSSAMPGVSSTDSSSASPTANSAKVFVRAGMNVPEHVRVAAVAYGEYDDAKRWCSTFRRQPPSSLWCNQVVPVAWSSTCDTRTCWPR